MDETNIIDTDKKVQAANVTTDSTYTVGTSTQGTGTVSLDENGNVVYTVTKGEDNAPLLTAQEQTHNTAMGMAASLAALNSGDDFIAKGLAQLTDTANSGADGIATFAAIGGGENRYKTGSHIKTNTWNGIVGLGKKENNFEYGIFAEHGTGNYRTFADYGNGSGSNKYTGGGLVGKYTLPNDCYVEGSFRGGRVKDTASNVLHDALGGSYGYNTKAKYYGAHIGIGKVFRYGDSREVNVYGKFFHNHRNGADFNAGGQYHLNGLDSDRVSLGARYGMTGKTWNWYGDLAYEYEFDGEATGTADGAAIRAADISGGSLRLTIGAKLKPSETSPWSADLNLTGYMGEHRGVGGAVGLAYAF